MTTTNEEIPPPTKESNKESEIITKKKKKNLMTITIKTKETQKKFQYNKFYHRNKSHKSVWEKRKCKGKNK